MSYFILCPDCISYYESDTQANVVCPSCLEKRRAKIKERENLPVGGLSSPDEDKYGLFTIGLGGGWLLKRKRSSNGRRVIRKPETMGG